MKEIFSRLTIVSPLAFPLILKGGQVIETVGDAAFAPHSSQTKTSK
jgi:hypothetical protein